jgi:hypothetical protein
MLQPLYVVAHQQVSANSSSRFSGMQERTSKFFMLRRDSEGSDNRQDVKGAKEQQEQRHNRRGAETQRKRRGNAEKSYNRKGAKAQRNAAKNFGFESGFPLRPFAPLRLCD